MFGLKKKKTQTEQNAATAVPTPEQTQPAEIPANQTVSAPNATNQEFTVPSSRQFNILLIEDDLFISELYKKQLTPAGFLVDIAMGAGEGIAKINSGKYDLLLLDIMLPGTSGIEILRSMKQDPKTADMPVIIVSNLEDDEIIQDSLALGANKFLTKSSITPLELVKIVQDTLSSSN